jgi:hypothetical protein
MAEWLKANRCWKVGTHKDWPKNKNDHQFQVYGSGDHYSFPDNDSIALRSDHDLIACLTHFQHKYRNATDSEKRGKYHRIFSLEIKDVSIKIYIEDYHDGKEKIVSEIYYD